jgi:hypothetical protein
MITLPSVLATAAVLVGLGGAPADPPGSPTPPLPVLRPKLALAAEVVTAAGLEARSRAALVERALGALRREVGWLSHPDALRLAFRAYYNFQAEQPHRVRNPYLYFVDFGLDSATPRGYVFDMRTLQVVDGPFTVAHGRGSDPDGDEVPSTFSNVPGSYATSLGLYLAEETYTFSGSAGGQPYSSVGLRLHGLSGRFNDMAFTRRVVAHGAPYVTPEEAGRSEGCPAMEPERAERLLPMIARGGLVFLFSPLDPAWLRNDPWARGAGWTAAANPSRRSAST